MKKIISLFLSVFFLTSCNQTNNLVSDSLNSDEISYEDVMLKQASKDLVDTNNIDQQQYEDFLSKYEKLSSRLSSSIYINSDKNSGFSISPLSIYMALALLAESTNNNTRHEILSALDMSLQEIREYTKVLYAKNTISLNLYERSISNSLWLNKNLSVKDNCMDTLANDYYTSLFSVDFDEKNEETNHLISSFIKEQTKGLIDNEYNFSEQTLFTLINTLYLLDTWSTSQEKLPYAEKVEFKNYNNTYNSVDLLKGNYNPGKIYSEESFSHFYTKTANNIKIKFIVPKDGYSLDEVFTEENIIKVNSCINYSDEEYSYYTKCHFPEFTAEINKNIKDILINSFNIEDLFNSDCDMSNLLETDASCNEFIHQSKVIVSNKGIESAAVTIVTSFGDGPIESEKPIKKETFTVDKNFGYIISDKDDVILFSGAVYNL